MSSHSGYVEDTSRVKSQQTQQQQQRNEPANQRFSNLIHDSELFLTKLREFKPQSLGCLEARRKSSSTLIFPNPQQACMGPSKCPRYPHHIKPTHGYWIECHGPGPLSQRSGEHQTLTDDVNQTEDGVGCIAGSASAAALKLAGDQHPRSPSKLAEEFRLNVDPNNRILTSSTHFPTTPTAERILTRHDKDILTSQDELDQLLRQDVMRRRQSIDLLEATPSPLHNQANTDSFQPFNQANTPDLSKSSSARPASSSSSSRTPIPHQDSLTSQDLATARSACAMRKRLNKRTMTRDDIDLHKPRRTPNITITEPSFNQSTVTYQPMTRRTPNPYSRQESLTQELKTMESFDSQVNSGATQCQVEKSMSIEAQSSIDEPPKEKGGAFDSSSNVRQQESFDNEDLSIVSNDSHELKPLRQQQHRPSIIHEDSDSEVEQGSDAAAKERRNLHCGLSTTTYQKKPYLQQQPFYQTTVATTSPTDTTVANSTVATTTNDQFRDGGLELISFEEENYEKHYYGREHWNYFTNDELLGPVMLSLKQEVNNQRDHFHVLLRTVSYTLHGTIPASTICADRYDREAIVRELSEIAKLKPPLMLGQLPSTPDELLKLDHIFIKTELKVGVINIKAGQAESEEAILGNKEESPLFTEFLDLLGDRIALKGFDRYKGGLDTVHNLTGIESIYTMWRNIEIMFHVSTMLPHEENDPQKLQKKRHIGNDIVCVAFIESDDTLFWPGCIKSYFLHTFITVRTSPKPLKEGEKRKYLVSCVCRNEVQYAFKPYLVEQDEFFKSDFFREWLLVKIVNGERASYSAPKFARMQDRTRSQLLEDIITNLANHLVTGQIPKPYRRGSWRPLGHTRASSPLEDSMKDYFEDYDQLAKDFCNAFCGPSRSMLCDVVFRVKDKDGIYKPVHGVRAIMAIRSRTFLEMLYGFVPPGAGPTNLQNQTNLRAIEMKALSGESSSGIGRELEHSKSLLAKRGSVGADSGKKLGEKERRQSMLPNLSKSINQKPNYLTVPNTSSGGGGGSGTGGLIKNAFNRLVSGNWSGWSGNIKGYKGDLMHIKVDQNKTKVDLNSLAICKEIAKIDADKLSQREFDIKEFDYETFQQTVEYIHNGQCKLSYETIPGLICAAEHYDLPDLLHACFHHANTHMKLSAAPKMMNALYQNSCFYITAMQLLDSIYEYIDPHATDFFTKVDYYELHESVFTSLLSRKTLQISELRKFQAMDGWTRHQLLHKHLQKHQLQRFQSVELEKTTEPTDSTRGQSTEKGQPAQEETETEYKNLMIRLNKEVNIKLDKISNEDLVKIVLPTKVFSNDKVFEVMADESRMEY